MIDLRRPDACISGKVVDVAVLDGITRNDDFRPATGLAVIDGSDGGSNNGFFIDFNPVVMVSTAGAFWDLFLHGALDAHSRFSQPRLADCRLAQIVDHLATGAARVARQAVDAA